MNRLRMISISAVILLLCCALACYAQNAPSQMPNAGDPSQSGNPQIGMGIDTGQSVMALANARMWPRIVQTLNLSTDQQRALMNIFLSSMKTYATLNGQIQADCISIAQVMLSDNPDRKKVESLVREINKLQLDQMLSGVDAMFAAKNVLTPAQWKTFQGMIPGLLAEAGQGHKPHGAPPVPGGDNQMPPPPSR